MSDRPSLQLRACTYQDIGKNTPVLNLDQIEYFLWIALDPELTSRCYFYEAAELDRKDGPKQFPDTFERVSPTWIKVRTDYINKSVGQHIYRLSFVDRDTDDCFSFFVSYIIQDDRPDKPYIYMNRKSEEPECNQKHNHAGEMQV